MKHKKNNEKKALIYIVSFLSISLFLILLGNLLFSSIYKNDFIMKGDVKLNISTLDYDTNKKTVFNVSKETLILTDEGDYSVSYFLNVDNSDSDALFRVYPVLKINDAIKTGAALDIYQTNSENDKYIHKDISFEKGGDEKYYFITSNSEKNSIFMKNTTLTLELTIVLEKEILESHLNDFELYLSFESEKVTTETEEKWKNEGAPAIWRI